MSPFFLFLLFLSSPGTHEAVKHRMHHCRPNLSMYVHVVLQPRDTFAACNGMAEGTSITM